MYWIFSFFFFVFSVSTGRHEQNKQKINIIGQLQPNLKKKNHLLKKLTTLDLSPKKGDTRVPVEHISPLSKKVNNMGHSYL